MEKLFKNTEPIILSEKARSILSDKAKTAQLIEAIYAERDNRFSKSEITVRRI